MRTRDGFTTLVANGLVAALLLATSALAQTSIARAVPTPRSQPTVTPATATVPVLAPGTDMLAGLPPYLPKAPVKGELKLAGSSAMNQLALLWSDGLKHVHPEANLKIEMYESGQVLDRLAKNEMQIGLMSRPLTDDELKAGGIIALPTAKDVLGIIVHPDNPLDKLTLEQGVRLLQDPADAKAPGAKVWGDLGLTGEWAKVPVNLYGRESGSGAWGYLVNRFLGPGAHAREQKQCNGYAELCGLVAKDRGGVGYVSLALSPPKTGKVLALQTTAGDVIAAPNMNGPIDPRYPLVRELYVVLRWQPGQKLSPVAEELLRYVLSRSGQQDAIKAGLIPLRRDEVLASRDQLGWAGVR